MTIVQLILDPGNPNRPGKNYTRRSGEIVVWRGVKGIISHRTGNQNPGATARAHYQYFNGGDRSASAHYFVDGQEIIRIIPEDEIAFHAGPANGDTIGIELCEPGGDWASGYPAYVRLHADICLRYGLNPLRDIRGHFQVDPVNRPQDPVGLFKWEPFLNDVANKLAELRSSSRTPILGAAQASAAQALAFWQKQTSVRAGVKYPAEEAAEIIKAYWRIGADEGVRPEVGFSQCLKETGYLTFERPDGTPGDVRPEQFNFAGLGATGGGNRGLSFPNIDAGVRAHLRHLRLYAEPDQNRARQLNDRVADPRGLPDYLLGSGPTVEDLGGKWAPSPDYGQSIVSDYLKPLLATPASVQAPPPAVSPDIERLRSEIDRLTAERDELKVTVEKIRTLIGQK